MLAFEAEVPADGKLVFAVLATPGSCTDSKKDGFEIRPLESWPR
jgi:hypothetical protein